VGLRHEQGREDREVRGVPPIKPRTDVGPHIGCPHWAVGMHRAADWSIGFPSRSTSALRMLVFVMPPDVRRSFKVTSEVD
jgi:hypothetical protein